MASFKTSTLAKRLGLCAAAVTALAAVAPAQAVVVTSMTAIPVPDSFDGVYINFLTGATGSSGASVSGWDFNPYNSGLSLSFFWNATPQQASGVAATATGPYSALAAGSVISAASTFAQVTATANTVPFQSGTNTLGFRFYNEATSAINYGYLTYASTGSNGFPGTIMGWSYENSGGAITVAAIPEPSTTLLLTLGALAIGATAMRRKQG